MTELKTVEVDHLHENMRIMAFVKFAKPYQGMEEAVSKFIKHNFKGTFVEILRQGRRLECSVEQIQNGDTLCRLFDLPQKFTVVTPGLIAELKKRGFVAFEVQVTEKTPAAKQEQHQAAVRQTNEFVQKAKESVNTRDQATAAVKDMMDNARRGKANPEEVRSYVDSIVENSSVEAMSAIACLKSSDQTYAHCTDAAAIFQLAYYEIKRRKGQPAIFQEPGMALMGAFMHDFGKAKVPKDVLESTVRFERNSREMQLLQSHPMFGAELLAGMNMPPYIVNMAHYHHVKMDTTMNSSYPQGVNYDDVLMETRLVSIVDVYQALIGRRSYKKSWPPAAAIRYIDALAGAEFAQDVWDDFMAVMGRYPKGTLVQLSDNSMAFVMSVPEGDLERPQVVVVRDSEGRDIKSNHTLIDLAVEQDLSIEKDLDHYEIFGDAAIDIFLNIDAH